MQSRGALPLGIRAASAALRLPHPAAACRLAPHTTPKCAAGAVMLQGLQELVVSAASAVGGPAASGGAVRVAADAVSDAVAGVVKDALLDE